MRALWRDLRFAARTWRATPGVAAVAVLVLALGIGANTAVFSVVDGILFRPLPHRDADRLVEVHTTFFKVDPKPMGLSLAEVREVQGTESLRDVAAYAAIDQTFSAGGAAERVHVGLGSVGLLSSLGVRPAHGRLFEAGEATPGRDGVVVISHGLWLRAFGGEASAVGQSLTLDGRPYAIIGVLPRGFAFGGDNDAWRPAVPPTEEEIRLGRYNHVLEVVGWLAPGRTLGQAQQELESLGGRLAAAHEQRCFNPDSGHRFVARPLADAIVGDDRAGAALLLCAVAAVLLIACANVASLMMARMSARHGEMALRAALGASPGRVLRQLLTEGLLLALCGGAVGVMLAAFSLDAIIAGIGRELPRKEAITIDGRVLLFTMLVATVTGLAAGLGPAWAAARTDLQNVLKQEARSSSGKASRRLRSGLVAAEIALSLVLLVSAGLVMRGFADLCRTDAGFRTEERLSLRVRVPSVAATSLAPMKDLLASRDNGPMAAFLGEFLTHLRGLPGVRATGAINLLPLGGQGNLSTFEVEGATPVGGQIDARQATEEIRLAGPGYFEAMGIPVIAGRTFRDSDTGSAPMVVVVSESMARRTWRDPDSALGKRVRISFLGTPAPGGDPDAWRAVVGVVGDVRHAGLDKPAAPHAYFAHAQTNIMGNDMAIVVHTDGDPLGIAAAVRAEAASVNPRVPVYEVKPLPDVLIASLGARRALVWLLALFAGMALLLALVGIYGVTSYSVAQRTRDVGIRTALGATERQILMMLARQGLGAVAAGIALGLGGAVAVSRVTASLVHGIAGPTTLVYVGLSLLVTLVAAAATLIPARRAARLDPASALRWG